MPERAATEQSRAPGGRDEAAKRRDATTEESPDVVARRLAAIVESSNDAIIGKTLDAIITSWNPGAERMYGYTAAEAIGQSVAMLVPPDRIDELARIMERLRRGEPIQHHETVRVRKDGQRIQVSVSISPIRDASGKVTGAATIARDITERVRMEAALRASEERFRAVFDGASAGIALVSLEGRVLESNHALQEMLGYDADELRGMALADLAHPEDLGLDRNLRDELIAGRRERYQIEKRYVRKEGRTIWGSLGVSIVGDPAAGPRLIVAMLQDVTERKRAERTRDEFLNLAAHELKTPLTAFKGSTQMLIKLGAHDDDERRLHQVIMAQSDRMAHVVQTLVDVTEIRSGELVLRPSRIDLCDLARSIATLAQATTSRHQISVSCGQPVVISADRERLREVFYSLVENAVKYSPHGGPVEITVRSEGGEAIVGIRDDGLGIPLAKQAELFQAFYQVAPMVSPTTGMGLGLFISREIIRRHHGRIWFESREGQGSTFWFALPGEG